jgi:arylesterase / paraoxonase
MRRRLLWGVLIVAVVAIGTFTVRILWLTGAFRHIEPHFAGECRLIRGPMGTEDLTIQPRTGVAYISSADRRAAAAGKPVPGAIYAYDLNVPDAEPVNLTPEAGVSFQPHGISLWTGKDGRDVLFVINHPPPGVGLHPHTVEIFDLIGGRLLHRATLSDPLLVMPNDLVAVGPDRFYLTNTHDNPPGFRQDIETYLQLSGAKVLYYGPGGFRVAIPDLVFPNGINVSPDGRRLYVAAVTDRNIRVYDRDPERETLRFRETIPLGSGPDNIELDERGNLWIGAHPKMLRVAKHRDDPEQSCPAQVLRVSPDGEVREIYLSNGTPIAAASVAAVRGDRLLVGQIFDDGFLDCRMAPGAES